MRTETQTNASEFAQLFEQSMATAPVREGDIVTGRVVRITKDFVIVDVGYKAEGQIPIEEFRSFEGDLGIQPGFEVDVQVEQLENDEGMMVLSKERADVFKTWDRLVEASERDEAIEGRVLSKVKGGLCVDIGVKAFLPGSQVDIRPVRNLDKYVGKTFKFKIVKLNKKRGNVVVSRKSVLEKEREVMKAETLENLAEGQILDGVVKNVTEYGVFVDLGGVDGLLHVTDMTWGRVGHPSEMFQVGDDIRVKVLKYDDKTGRVSLGYKQLQPDPWGEVEMKFPVGSRVSGKVVNLTDYGAFIELEQGVEGLIHVSEMSWTKKVKHPSKLLNVGDTVDAVVLDVDTSNKRISLGLKQTQTNPWETMVERYPLGTQVSGTVKNIADFGIFIDLNGEIDALVHISDISWIQNFEHPSELFKKGDMVTGIVLNVDPEGERFSVGVKQLTDSPWRQIMDNYPVGDVNTGKVLGKSSLGWVVELEPLVIGLVPNECGLETEIGAEVTVAVATVDQNERRFTFEPKA